MTRLKELRVSRGETQAEIAVLLGITRAAYTNIELGNRDPDTSTLCTLAHHYGVSTDYLLGLDEKKEAAVPKDDGLSDETRELMQLLPRLTPDQKQLLLAQIKTLLSLQE